MATTVARDIVSDTCMRDSLQSSCDKLQAAYMGALLRHRSACMLAFSALLFGRCHDRLVDFTSVIVGNSLPPGGVT
jgi:hypothetical protein